jgi:hypothetical protein
MDLRMLEDWLDNIKTKEDCHKEIFIQSGEEFHPEEKLDEVEFVPVQGEEPIEREILEEIIEN